MKIKSCRLNHLKDPMGFYLPQTTFTWTEDMGDASVQARKILVKSGNETVLDTGWTDLDPLSAKVQISLKPFTEYTWTVFCLLTNGETVSSEQNKFETGLSDSPWQAPWIGCDDNETRLPVFTKDFHLSKELLKARLYICGLGLYEASVNGKKAGNEYLTPYCNAYDQWLQLQTFDITDLVNENSQISVTLGNGWYKGRFGFDRSEKPHYGESWKLTAMIRLTYTDETTEEIVTDDTWNVTRSCITFSNIYDGEHRDDTLEAIPATAAVITDAPAGRLMDRLSLPVIEHEILPVQKLIHSPKGETIVDLGQNFSGTFRIQVDVPKGTVIRIQTGEVLQDGCFYNDNLRTAKSEYVYTSDGTPKTIQPSFTFFGYRYAKIEGIDHFKQEDFEGIALYSEYDTRGTLKTGNEKINRLILNAEWGMKSNFLDVPTDCPQRDERMGWTGDAEVFAPTALLFGNVYAFYTKYLYDMFEEQKKYDGCVPFVVPSFGIDQGAAAWGDAAAIIPYVMYEADGDTTILSQQYDSIKAWVEFLRSKDGDDHGWRKAFQFGDWLALDGSGGVDEVKGGTDDGFVADAYYLWSTRILRKTAAILDKQDDKRVYAALEQKILAGIQDEYFSPNGRCCIDTQTAYLLTLTLGLSPRMERIPEDFVEKMDKSSHKLQTGFVGTPLLLEQLSAIGHSDIAYELLLNEDYPGWLYEVNLGATTIWERWNSMNPDGSVSSTGMNSFNHYSYGACVRWIFERAAGLRRDPEIPGYKSVIFAPELNYALHSAQATYNSASGRWECGWEILDPHTVHVHLHVPYGCSTQVNLPYLDKNSVDLNDPLVNASKALSAGTYEITYTTTVSLKPEYSIHMTALQLLAEPKTRAILQELIPDINFIPERYKAMPLEEIMHHPSADVTQEMIDAVAQALAKIQ